MAHGIVTLKQKQDLLSSKLTNTIYSSTLVNNKLDRAQLKPGM